MGAAAALALLLSPIAAACSTSGDGDDATTTTTEATTETTSDDTTTTTEDDDPGGDETTTTESRGSGGDDTVMAAFIAGATAALLEDPSLEMDRSQAECTATEWAETLGPDRITDRSFDPETFTRGDTELAGELVDGMTGCGLDLDQMMYDELTVNQGLSDSQATCVVGELPPGALREVIALEMAGELQGDDDPITDVFFAAGLACAEA